jgi:hypothetical protein
VHCGDYDNFKSSMLAMVMSIHGLLEALKAYNVDVMIKLLIPLLTFRIRNNCEC